MILFDVSTSEFDFYAPHDVLRLVAYLIRRRYIYNMIIKIEQEGRFARRKGELSLAP